ncbi:MAG: hypothetical protein M1837_006425 [Sclerophora amabilis]|nr:MAG: hypothetical protein M1837_006425 [Sclerophora amabilis]
MGFRSVVSSSRPETTIRVVQLGLSVAFLLLIVFCRHHHGNWKESALIRPVGMGYLTSTLTLWLLVYQLHTLHRGVVAMEGRVFARISCEAILVVLWASSIGLMAVHIPQDPSRDRWWRPPPDVAWYIAMFFALMEL